MVGDGAWRSWRVRGLGSWVAHGVGSRDRRSGVAADLISGLSVFGIPEN